MAYQKFSARRGDIRLHTIVQPTVDKATGDALSLAGNAHALRKVETEHGISRARARCWRPGALATTRIAVYPAQRCRESADDYALSFQKSHGHNTD